MSYTLLLFTAYAIVRTVPSAIGQIGGKKKTSNRSLAPPILTCAPQPTHLRPPPCLPQCHDLNSKFLFKLPPPPCLPQCHDLKPNSLFELPPPCLPQCHDLKSNSLFKLPPLCIPQCHDLKSNSLFKLPPPCLPQCHDLNSKSLFELPPLAFVSTHAASVNVFHIPLPSTMPWILKSNSSHLRQSPRSCAIHYAIMPQLI